jgi:pyrroloquinoline quinone (PQQ) biosynthesis protein C
MASVDINAPDPFLILCPHVTLDVDRGRLVADTPDVTFTFECREPDLLRDALLVFRRGASPRTAIRACRLSVTELQPAVDALASHDALVDLRPLLFAPTVESWLDAYFSICDRWALDIFACEFWFTMLEGTATVDLVLGWAREFYHRTVGADEHNELAVRHCRDRLMRDALAVHFKEEQGHGEMFLQGLAMCGVPRAEVQRSNPLPTTRNLIEYMNELAVRDSLAYLGCYGILHSPRRGQTLERLRSQFARLAELYPLAAPAIRAIEEHAALDLTLGHEAIELERYVRIKGIPTSEGSTRVIRAAHGMARAFSGFFAGILKQYDSAAAAGALRPM